ncbi:hypothetical protein [Terribacillus saccharophilus]|uniref:hypothetical protein n=1 Tax=Terribacillus saccharophilus TaxID=361277 RepID=UPI000BA5DAE4|nr:hypothetical protein [Terribacillus saccharophilus]PAF19713.1 hypothetical protein CHH51_01225 [Terribacillus saccharophilus]
MGNLESRFVGKALTNLIESGDVNGVEFAMETHASTALVSSMKQDKRKMTPDMASHSIAVLDHPTYEMELLHEFSDGKTSPRLNGTAIDMDNHLAVGIKAVKELKEALSHIDLTKLLAKPDMSDEHTREYVERMLKELKEGLIYGDNFYGIMAQMYNQSTKSISNAVLRKQKAEGTLR